MRQIRSPLVLLLAALVGHPAQAADSTLAILGKLKSFRDAGVSLFEGAAKGLKEDDEKDLADMVQKWSDDWLSILGLNRGMTGLAKDFVLNYLGRSAYHDSNGKLIDSIKTAASAFPSGKKDVTDSAVAELKKEVTKICVEGQKVFESGGSLYTMLAELENILGRDKVIKQLQKGLKSNSQVKKAFVYFSGPQPSDSDDDIEDEDSEEL